MIDSDGIAQLVKGLFWGGFPCFISMELLERKKGNIILTVDRYTLFLLNDDLAKFYPADLKNLRKLKKYCANPSKGARDLFLTH